MRNLITGVLFAIVPGKKQWLPDQTGITHFCPEQKMKQAPATMVYCQSTSRTLSDAEPSQLLSTRLLAKEFCVGLLKG